VETDMSALPATATDAVADLSADELKQRLDAAQGRAETARQNRHAAVALAEDAQTDFLEAVAARDAAADDGAAVKLGKRADEAEHTLAARKRRADAASAAHAQAEEAVTPLAREASRRAAHEVRAEALGRLEVSERQIRRAYGNFFSALAGHDAVAAEAAARFDGTASVLGSSPLPDNAAAVLRKLSNELASGGFTRAFQIAIHGPDDSPRALSTLREWAAGPKE
jgi:hypothetical protein